MVETVLQDLDERLPGPLGGGKEADELRAMQVRRRKDRRVTCARTVLKDLSNAQYRRVAQREF
jgi:hypothetical protein